MYCSQCGAKIGETDMFCPKCGKGSSDKTTSETEERELYSFGPLGVIICYSRPTMFALTYRNMTRVMLTDYRIYGFPKGSLAPTEMIPFKSKAHFQVPYETILATEQVSFGLQKGVWIQYRAGEKLKEVSILCSPVNSHHIAKTYELLKNRASAR
jgi:hypothetical protein